MKNCIDCFHRIQTGIEPYHCALYSLLCSSSRNKPRFLSNGTEPIPKRKPIGVNKVKGIIAFTDTDKAWEVRKRQVPIYPDGMELTDESKKKIRSWIKSQRGRK